MQHYCSKGFEKAREVLKVSLNNWSFFCSYLLTSQQLVDYFQEKNYHISL